MDTSRSQRWRERRALWATDSLVINPNAYSADIIDHAAARAFIAEHHYLPSYPAAQVAVGLFGRRAVLEGVAVFAVPATDAWVILPGCSISDSTPPRDSPRMITLVRAHRSRAACYPPATRKLTMPPNRRICR